MYTPQKFSETDQTRLDWLVDHDAFGTLVSLVDNVPFASHLPVLCRREGESVTLIGHWAKANPQWQTIDQQRCLFIVHGPHAYISARWYPNSENFVPTWNYATAHLYGQIRILQAEEDLASIVSGLVEKYEAGAAEPWRFDRSNQAQLKKLRGIVGFEFSAQEIQLKFKLGQNHPSENTKGAIRGLSEHPTDDSRDVAVLMQEALAKRVG